MASESFPPPARVDVGGYAFFPSMRLGCGQLVRVARAHCTSANLCGKLVAAERMSEYLAREGMVLKVLRAHPHPNILMPLAVVEGKPAAASPSTPAASASEAQPSAGLSGVIFPEVGEDLHTYVRAHKGLPERQAKHIFRAILSAVAHCHAHRIVLRDLRLGKIFFRPGSNTEVVIGELDGSQVVSHSAPFLSDRKGSPAFVSPEVLVSQSFDGAAADMWALGVTLYILLTGTYPFQDTQLATLFQKIQQGHTAVHFPSTMSEAARDIIRSLLVREPYLRLTAPQVLADLWLEEVPPPVPSPTEDDDWFGLRLGSAAAEPAATASTRHAHSQRRQAQQLHQQQQQLFLLQQQQQQQHLLLQQQQLFLQQQQQQQQQHTIVHRRHHQQQHLQLIPQHLLSSPVGLASAWSPAAMAAVASAAAAAVAAAAAASATTYDLATTNSVAGPGVMLPAPGPVLSLPISPPHITSSPFVMSLAPSGSGLAALAGSSLLAGSPAISPSGSPAVSPTMSPTMGVSSAAVTAAAVDAGLAYPTGMRRRRRSSSDYNIVVKRNRGDYEASEEDSGAGPASSVALPVAAPTAAAPSSSSSSATVGANNRTSRDNETTLSRDGNGDESF